LDTRQTKPWLDEKVQNRETAKKQTTVKEPLKKQRAAGTGNVAEKGTTQKHPKKSRGLAKGGETTSKKKKTKHWKEKKEERKKLPSPKGTRDPKKKNLGSRPALKKSSGENRTTHTHLFKNVQNGAIS